MNMRRFIARHGLKNKQIVETMREEFPQYDKYLHSHACNEKRSGVTVCPRGSRLLKEKYAGADQRAADLPTVKCRLPNEVRDALHEKWESEGYHTQQAGMVHIITRYLKGDPYGKE